MSKSVPLTGYLHFMWAGLARHLQTGAFLPSQRFLIQTMLNPIPTDYRGRVVELGTGNGTLTVRLAARCPHASIVACEINPTLAQDTRLTLARAGVNGQVQVRENSAQQVLADLVRQPGEKPGFIISGLPLGNLPKREVVDLLEAASSVLSPKGVFVQVQHFLLDRKYIRMVFGNVRTVPVVFNVPPAFVYFAQK